VLPGLGRARGLAQRDQVLDDAGPGVPGHCLDQGGVRRHDVVPDERRGLVRRSPVAAGPVVTVEALAGSETPRSADGADRRGFTWPDWVLRTRETSWRITVSTVASSMRHRVTGLAAEAAFFTVLSVPPLIFALAGAIGYVTESFSPDQV